MTGKQNFPNEMEEEKKESKTLFSPVNFHNNTEYFKLPGIKWVSDCSLSDPSTSTSISSSSDSSCALSTTTVGSTDVEWITGSSSEMILSSRTCCICTSETKIVSLDCPSLAAPDCAKVLFCRNEKEQCSLVERGSAEQAPSARSTAERKGKKQQLRRLLFSLHPGQN